LPAESTLTRAVSAHNGGDVENGGLLQELDDGATKVQRIHIHM
jgi:hypothetical protein